MAPVVEDTDLDYQQRELGAEGKGTRGTGVLAQTPLCPSFPAPPSPPATH